MEFKTLLEHLSAADVKFILIGGVAAIVHGSATHTRDVDVVYARARDNVTRLVDALKPLRPYLRGAPEGLPFDWSVETVLAGLNFTLRTTIGDLDILGEVAGGGTYEQLLPHTIGVDAFGVSMRCVTLDMLIRLKRAAGRPRDFNMVAELEALREEIHKRG